MAFCKNCGNQLPEGAVACPSCGTATTEEKKKASTDFSEILTKLDNTNDTTSQLDPADIESNKLMAVLAYLSWLVLIPLFAAKGSRFARFHVNQGLVLAIANLAFNVATKIVVSVLTAIAYVLGSIVSTILGIANLAFLILAIIGIVNVVNGKAKELPIIGSIILIK